MKLQDKVYWPIMAIFIGIEHSAYFIHTGGNPWATKLYTVGLVALGAWCTLRYRWNDWTPGLDLLEAKQDEEGHHVLVCRYESRMEKWREMATDVGIWVFSLTVLAVLSFTGLLVWAFLLFLIGMAISPFWPRIKPWAIWLRARARYAGGRLHKWYCNVRQK